MLNTNEMILDVLKHELEYVDPDTDYSQWVLGVRANQAPQCVLKLLDNQQRARSICFWLFH